MPKPKAIPVSQMQKISGSGVFVKRFGRHAGTTMKPYAHRDDYYIVVLLTGGSAGVDIDFRRIQLEAGCLLMVSPWQIHGKPEGERWEAEGWMLAFSPEMLSESEARLIGQYSVSPRPFRPDSQTAGEIGALCGMLERHIGDDSVSGALAAAVKSLVIASLGTSGGEIAGRYRAITLRLNKLLDLHLAATKSPAAYASMLNISGVYLNEAVRGATGLSAGAYIRARAMVQAKRYLAYTSLSAKEIACSLGYEDYAYFSRLFRKSVGVSPTEYRKNLV